MFLITGTIYVYLSDRSPTKAKSSIAPSSSVQVSAPKPALPGPNAPEGVAVNSIVSPVKVGSNSSISISTNALSTCNITVTYNNILSTDSGLAGTKKANDYGQVSWSWTVPINTPLGSWPVKVTCVYRGRSGVVISNLVVTK